MVIILIIDGQSHFLTGTVMWVAIRGTVTWLALWGTSGSTLNQWACVHNGWPFKHTGWGWGWESWFACCTLTKVLLKYLRPPSKSKIVRISVWLNESRKEEERWLSVQSKCNEKMKGLKWILFAIKGHKPLRGETCD